MHIVYTYSIPIYYMSCVLGLDNVWMSGPDHEKQSFGGVASTLNSANYGLSLPTKGWQYWNNDWHDDDTMELITLNE